jgi:MFS family permease
MNEQKTAESKIAGRRVLAACYIGMLAMSCSIQALSPVNHKIQEALYLDYGRLGFLMGAISVPGIGLAIPGGQWADRWGSRIILHASFLSLLVGALLFVFTRTYFFLCAGRIISGIGCAFLSVVLPGILAPYFERKNLGNAMGIFNTALPLGSIATLTFLGSLGARMGWFNVFLIPAGAGIIAILGAVLLLPPEKRCTTYDHRRVMLPGAGPLWFLAAAVLFSNMATMGYVTIAPSFFELRGIPFDRIGLMLSAVLVGTLFLAPLAGYLSMARGMARVLVFWGSLVMALSLYCIPHPWVHLSAVLVMLAVSAGVIMTPVYIMVPRFVPGNLLNTGYGVIMAFMLLGCLTGPYLAGIFVDATRGSFEWGFTFLALSSVGAALMVLLMGKEEPQNPAVIG